MNIPNLAHRALACVALSAFHDNYIWLISDGSYAVVVDPGDAVPVQTYLHAQSLRLSAILLTHHHSDHIGGVPALVQGQHIPVYGPASESIGTVNRPVREGDTVQIMAPELCLQVLDIPGHTLGHIAFFLQNASAGPPRVFCGDTLFACGCGRLFEGTPRQMLASLDKLATLPEPTLIHCAHEYTLANIRFARACAPEDIELQHWQRYAEMLRAKNLPTVPTTLAHEKRVNPFLRLEEVPKVQQQRMGACKDRLAVFTALRAWKDHF